MSFMVVLSSHADSTSDNLLNNNTFDENTDGWTLSDPNVKRDSNSYPDAGSSPTIRFKGQTSTITQSVDTSSLETNKEITGVTIKYHGYGCGNSPGGWCNDEADDTIVTNVTFKSATNTEISSNTIAVPYEDGWTYHTFTKSINDTFLTGETGITFSLQGIDTGDSSNWLGPITDNYELLITYQDYIVPVIEPVVIEPVVIEPVVIVEPTMIEGLSLDTEIVNDVILEPVTMEVPEITIDIPIDMSIDIPVEMPVNIELPPLPTEIEVTEEIQEITEINVDQPVEIESEVAELEQPEELNDSTMEEDLKESAVNEQETETENETNEESKLSKSTGGDNEPKKQASNKDGKKSKDKKESKKENVQRQDVPSNKKIKTVDKRPVGKTKGNVPTTDSMETIDLPINYFTQLQELVIITETVSLTQEMVYEQDISTFTSSSTYDNLIGSSSSRWVRMVDVRPKHTFSGYGR